MLRKPFHGMPKLPAIGTPSPRFSPVRESPARLTPLSSRSPLPPLFYCQKNLPPTSHFRFTRQTTIFPPLSTSSFATAPPSTAAHFSRAPEPNPNTSEDQVEGEGSDRKRRSQICPDDGGTLESPKPKRKRKLNLRHFPLLMWWIELSSWEKTKKIVSALCSETTQDVVDRFYREMSKEVETILHERDQRTLPEELYRRVVVTCVSGDGTCDVFVLRTKQRSLSVVKESCIEIEVESVTTYIRPQVIYVQYPGKPLERLTLKRNYKVVNKLDISPKRGDRVAFEEAMKYGGKVVPGHPEQLANKLEVYLEHEIRVAYEEAMKYGSKVILGDCPLQVILLRTTWAMQLWEKTKLLVGNLLKRKDLLFFLFRWLLETWAKQLWKKTKLIVAKLLYAKGMDRPEVPSKKPAVSTVKMLSSLGVAVAGVAFLSGIYFGWKK